MKIFLEPPKNVCKNGVSPPFAGHIRFFDSKNTAITGFPAYSSVDVNVKESSQLNAIAANRRCLLC